MHYPKENPIYNIVENNLGDWPAYGAKVTFLKSADHQLQVPRIFLPSYRPNSRRAIIAASGLHMDEPDGPIFFSNAKKMTDAFDGLRLTHHLLIYPAINQSARHHVYGWFAEYPYLRNDPVYNVNFNGGWGQPTKPAEVALVERDIENFLHAGYRVDLGISGHTDSTEPARAYAWVSGMGARDLEVYSQMFRHVHPKDSVVEQFKVPLRDPSFFRNGLMVNSFDRDSWESWLWLKGIPTLNLEAQWERVDRNGETQANFYQASLRSVYDLPLVRAPLDSPQPRLNLADIKIDVANDEDEP